MKEIKLAGGNVAIIDDEDFEKINQHKWSESTSKISNTIYAIRGFRVNKKRKAISMHREIMNITSKLEVDHIDGNGLNNQKLNLRICTHAQNLLNSSKYKNSSSKFKGVYFGKTQKKWIAQISIDGKNKHLGCFENEKDAAKQYNYFAKMYYGEYARLNEIS